MDKNFLDRAVETNFNLFFGQSNFLNFLGGIIRGRISKALIKEI